MDADASVNTDASVNNTDVSANRDAAEAQALLKAMAENVGREVHVSFCRAASTDKDVDLPRSQNQEEEPEEFYEFTAEDYARMMANRKEEIFLKTRKFREAEAAARRARITKAVIRVQFPDNYVLEANFKPSDSLSTLIELLKKVITRTDVPFYLYTTPPKQRLQDLDRDFYTAGLTPGAIVYFSYDPPKGATEDIRAILDGPYLKSEVMALRDLHLLQEPSVTTEKATDPKPSSNPSEHNIKQEVNTRPRKIGTKPKWMKL